MQADFKKVYCDHYRCDASRFHQDLLKRSLFLPGRLFFMFTRVFVPQAFSGESSLIDHVGRANSVNEIRDELDFYHHKHVSQSALKENFFLRVSGQKLIRMAKELGLPSSV